MDTDVNRRSVLAGMGGALGVGGAMATGGRALAKSAPSDPVIERKVRDLLRRMTIEEKIGQLRQDSWNGDTGPGGGDTADTEKAARNGTLGSVLNIYGAKHANALQRIAVEESRLGIPLLFGLDIIHGFWTTFPIPLAQASSFDPSVVTEDAEVSAKEGRSNGVHWTFAPMIDVTHEPRWGRIAEGSGEDPYLTERLAEAKVRGYQGDDYSAHDRLAACAKHFVAYGGAEGGRDYNTVDVSAYRLRNTYLPPFRGAIRADVATVMGAFNTIGGVPAHGSKRMLRGLLKGDWDFDGFVVSDWTAVRELIPHGFAANKTQAARQALNAGVDMEMVSKTLAEHGKELVESGRIDRKRLDDAVSRILRIKFRAGLFDNPYADESREITEPDRQARKAARSAAARSTVLLKNERVLPLRRSGGSIAVVGPFGDSDDLHGTWAGPGADRFSAVTLLGGIRAATEDIRITHERGVAPEGDDTSGIARAVEAAKAADVTVVAVGEPSAMSGEASSRSMIDLPGKQRELIREIAKTGKPFVVVLINGRPLTIGEWADDAPAILEAWHPGIEGGNAVADVLFGVVNPGGKLPVTFPRAVGQIPIYYNHESTGRPYDPDNFYTSKYIDLPHGPQFPFGHGLSYTTFEIGEPSLSTERIPARALRKGSVVEVSVPVTNTGGRDGDEVVQLYIHDVTASIVQPVRRLRGFQRVTLRAGQRRTVRFRLTDEDLGFFGDGEDETLLIEPGSVDVYVGASSTTENKTGLTIT